MANARYKNAIFVDTASAGVTCDAIVPKLRGVLLTPSAANARVVIKATDNSGIVLVDFKAESANESRFLDLTLGGLEGIQVSQVLYIATLTNVQTVMLYGDFFLQAGRAQ